MPPRRVVPLLWRLFIPNATVLLVAGVVLAVQPANGRIVALAAGVAVMLAINVVLMRRAFAPLQRLTELMGAVDPLRPGPRIAVSDPGSEVTILSEAFNSMLGRLEAERRASVERALAEREDERRHVAAALHDEIGQTLTALMLQQTRIAERVPGDDRTEALEVRDGLLGAIEDVRRLATSLRPEALDTLGLAAALAHLCERLTARTGVQVECALSRDLPALGRNVELALYRVGQESLTNAIRHARASRVSVALQADDGLVVLEIADDGCGFDAGATEERGLRGLRERALLVGGKLQVAGRPGAGTTVRLELPEAEPGE